ncbi:alpha/beta fold hydrolase [Nocardia sp. NPDC052278]|uniref:alpha/beta fold hydrolase n=1 Tax=unclassified Nocardia TaxID=2637762 RepID=UPI0036B8D520
MGGATKRSVAVPSAAYRRGSGEPLLLIHGFTLNWQSWSGVIDELGADFDMLAPTLPGHWGGPEVDRLLRIADFVDFLEACMDAAGWVDAHIAGNSLGGWLALELAARGRARSVTAVAPAGLWQPSDAAAETVHRKFRSFSRFAPGLRFASHPMVPNIARRTILRSFAHRPDLVSADLAAVTIEAPAHCRCFASVTNDPTATAVDAMRRVDVPATVLFCERDRVIPPARYGRTILAEMPAITAKTLPEVGHVPMLEASDLIATEIRQFVDSACGRTRRSA